MLKRAVKYSLGFCVALWYAAIGKRRRLLSYYDGEGTCLAIVGHDPKAKDLERLLEWYLKHGFTFVLPSWPVSALRGKRRLAWLSFDDGWASFKTDVLPVLEKLNIPATLFIAPHETEQGQLWTNGTRAHLGQSKIREMYSMPFAKRQEMVDAVFARFGNRRALLSKDEVVELSHHKLVDIQNHTMTHLSCSRRHVAEVVEDIKLAQATLKQWIGRECEMVCYPFCHHTAETDAAIRNLGMIPVSGDAGEGTLARIGETRNMFRDSASLQENIGRSLNAWRKVTVA